MPSRRREVPASCSAFEGRKQQGEKRSRKGLECRALRCWTLTQAGRGLLDEATLYFL